MDSWFFPPNHFGIEYLLEMEEERGKRGHANQVAVAFLSPRDALVSS